MQRIAKIAFWGKRTIAALFLIMLSGCGTSGTTLSHEPANLSGGAPSPVNGNTQPDTAKGETSQPAAVSPQESVQRQTVVLFFPDRQLLNLYREKQEISFQTKQELPAKALEAWIKGPKAKRLTGILPADVKVEYVKDVGNGRAEVSFSKEMKNWNHGSTEESMLANAVPLILQSFGFEEAVVLVEGKPDEIVFSHMGAGRPFRAGNPESYEWVQE